MPAFTLDARSLHQLRARLGNPAPNATSDALHDAGLASGGLLVARWRERLGGPGGLQEPEHLDTQWFASVLDELCRDLGWGSLTVVPVGDEAVLLESADWAEAASEGGAEPGCRFTAGALSAFLTELAGAPLIVLEVACRSAGGDQCRFLAGSEEMVALVRDLLQAGRPWQEALSTPPAG